MPSATLLIVDDDKAVRTALRINLTRAGYTIITANNGGEALKVLGEKPIDLVLSDVMMPGQSGLSLLAQIKESWPDTSVIMMTGFGNVDDAVNAMRQGASHYLIKPISKDALIVHIEKALENKRLKKDYDALQTKVSQTYRFGNLIGNNLKMRQLYDLASHVAETSATVLIMGPTGTGKELLANAIHYNSPRKNKPFIRVNCAALPETLLESELFGHERGAFSGAIRQHRGRFELADTGTLLLDEIGDISLAMQVKLLRVLEAGEFQRLGGVDTMKVDVRVVTATNRDLAEEVDNGNFRQDLFYRLNVFALNIPPLKERPDDIPLLVEHFIQKYAQKNNKEIGSISPDCLEQMLRYDWPGNVRELEHVIERAVILTRGPEIGHVDLPDAKPAAMEARGVKMQLADALRECERSTIVRALRDNEGVQARAARDLGISRSNLNYRLNKLGIKVANVVPGAGR